MGMVGHTGMNVCVGSGCKRDCQHVLGGQGKLFTRRGPWWRDAARREFVIKLDSQSVS